MLEHGADAPPSETIVAAGSNWRSWHHRPTGAELAAGDFVKIDFGALVAGYHSDMTRTFVLGSADWQRGDLYAGFRSPARGSGGAGMRGGAGGGRRGSAPGDHRWATGTTSAMARHGVDQIHEAPGINSAAVGRLPEGAVVTVEPGVYLPGQSGGGGRIEDTLLVGERGSGVAQPLPLKERGTEVGIGGATVQG